METGSYGYPNSHKSADRSYAYRISSTQRLARRYIGRLLTYSDEHSGWYMEKLMGAIFPSLLVMGGTLFVVAIVTLSRRWTHRHRRRSPFTGDFLRNPGNTLLGQLDDVRVDLMGYVAASMIMPLLCFSIPITQAWWSKQPVTSSNWFVYGVIGLVASGVISVKLVVAVRRVQQLRLGYEGELAVGQELNQLMSQGFRVYHDFPAGSFNIDHVVIGPTGVFAVETKARRKPITKDRRADACVEYTGTIFKFPSWKDQKTLVQADRQAQWLSRWLTSAIGESVTARAVVALPGWFVKQTGRGGILVFKGKRPDTLFPKVQGNRMSQSMIQRIAHQVEAKCRDVSPRAYVDELKEAS